MVADLINGERLFIALEIDLDIVPIDHLDTYTAIKYFLTLENKPPTDVENLKKVDRYFQVFDHLCAVSSWQKASYILSICPIKNRCKLHEQLRVWAYYPKQIELYKILFGKANVEQDLVCLNGLGRAFYNLSDYDKSLDYYQQLLKLARLNNNRLAEVKAINGLADIRYIKHNYSEAIALYENQLGIAREIGDREQEGYALISLGSALYFESFANKKKKFQQKELNYLEESLIIAQNLNNQEMESLCLTRISKVYFERANYSLALKYLHQKLDICDKINARHDKCIALQALGECFTMLKQSENALKYLQESLIVVREIGDKFSECSILNAIGVTYCYELKQYQTALPYFEKALAIINKLDLKDNIAICIVNVFTCHFSLKNKQESAFYLSMAQSFVVESKSLESKGLVMMAIANAYYGRNEVWYKLWGIILAIRSLIMIPPWRSANGRLAMKMAVKEIFGLEI